MEQEVFEPQVAELAATTTNKALKGAATELLRALGFTRWIYAADNPYGAMGFPATLANEFGMWMIEYMTKGYVRVDPIVSHCRASTEPYFWDA
jgi:creatinine amidohydrolase/Fe(II)-dependent formamide hydrolase-like protein